MQELDVLAKSHWGNLGSILGDRCFAWKQRHARLEHWCFCALGELCSPTSWDWNVASQFTLKHCISVHIHLFLLQGCHPRVIGIFSVCSVVVVDRLCDSRHSAVIPVIILIMMYSALLDVNVAFTLICPSTSWVEGYKKPPKHDRDEYMTLWYKTLQFHMQA